MKLVLFTVEEANRLLDEIRPELMRLVEAKREFDGLESRIAVLTLASAGASPANPDAQELRALQARLQQIGTRLTQGIGAIHRRGCLVKDLDRGLVDFYALSGDRLVFLCWQLGEPEVEHWHTLEGGFASRQRLDHTELE